MAAYPDAAARMLVVFAASAAPWVSCLARSIAATTWETSPVSRSTSVPVPLIAHHPLLPVRTVLREGGLPPP
jgi:hypothetical protein